MLFSLALELAIGAWGISITCWRLYSANSIYIDGEEYMSPDICMWLSDFSVCWTAAAVSLAGVSVGLVFIAVSILCERKGSAVGGQ